MRAAERLELIGADQTRGLEKQFMLQMIDMQWREHLVHLDHLRGVIGLRGYGQRDPLQEYKSEAFSLFEALIAHLREAVTAQLNAFTHTCFTVAPYDSYVDVAEALRMLEEPAAVAARRGLSMEDAIPAPLRGIQQKAGA